VSGLVDAGDLVEVRNSRDFELHAVSYPYARPAVKAFIERLSSHYRAACGEKLTVTSLTRPIDRQPANASSDSVHPTGMAVDLRIPSKQSCRTWLENYLLDMEGDDVLDVTRERRPPHYHVAVFPDTYEQYVVGLSTSTQEYTVRRGDTLSRIAASTGTSVAQLRATNGLRNDVIQVGQKLLVRAAESPSQVTTTVAASSASAPVLAVTETRNQAAVPTVSTHRVKRGETLSKIATSTGTTVAELRAANGLRNDMLQIGQELIVHAAGSPSAELAVTESRNQVAAATSSIHRVKRGETLWRIARLYGTTTDALATKNNLASDILQVGQTLTIE
jgi:LysM repeat protein